MIDTLALFWAIGGFGYVMWRIIRMERGAAQRTRSANRIGSAQ